MKHACPRCGFQTGHQAWYDRNPVVAAVAAVPVIIFSIAAVLTYPWVLIPVLVVVCAVVVDRRRRQQAAIAARADYDYRQQMAAIAWNGSGWRLAAKVDAPAIRPTSSTD